MKNIKKKLFKILERRVKLEKLRGNNPPYDLEVSVGFLIDSLFEFDEDEILNYLKSESVSPFNDDRDIWNIVFNDSRIKKLIDSKWKFPLK